MRTPAIQLSVRAAVAAALAWWIADALHAHYAIYALIAAVLVTDLSPANSRRLALQRLAGTLVGAMVGALLLPWLDIRAIALGVAILAAMLLAFALRLENAGARVAGYVAAIVMLAHGDDAWQYAFDRAWETIVGIGVALLVGLVPLWMRERRTK
ncbi:hypothetical protein LF41_2329 [Lysobacter dokdonensis DS-58]|uniref:Integral membrane bound transporter domain-containing protein n=1 Tax=Lysobacter dokdonensis DS-58 TaxID=1300345 RepID=A0A0A2WI14_9GAMM|nr:FUSC family protein [Lysobacter dokdonensis]KGQ19826.1 hypothetical protein LF41_2329 [Lysobacter dokdonensis DS-58]